MDTRLLITPQPAKLDRLHAGAPQVLERTGVQVEGAEARETFRRGGARVEADGRVHIPPKLVGWALSVTPHRYTLDWA
ncbi:MAG: trimethylamine methyltransferase family protein [Chloroflexi bacterium]|nr:trimethylamine methyltransferase family protein [Chloroflexota bacterium]